MSFRVTSVRADVIILDLLKLTVRYYEAIFGEISSSAKIKAPLRCKYYRWVSVHYISYVLLICPCEAVPLTLNLNIQNFSSWTTTKSIPHKINFFIFKPWTIHSMYIYL
jgi:hypothetical protein